MAAVVEEYEARVGDVVDDRDTDPKRHYPVLPSADQKDGRLDAGQVRRGDGRFMPGCALSSR